MADVRPFHGVVYSPARIPDLSVVLSQPHDRIDPERQSRYYALSPYNIVRIIKGSPADPGPSTHPNGASVHARGRAWYEHWLDEGVLIRDDRPAFYLTRQDFTLNGRTHARMGLIAAVRLSSFDEKQVLPHELIHPGPRIDRLALLENLSVNAEPIMMLYPDASHEIAGLLSGAAGGRAPDREGVEMQENGVTQRLWRITDAGLIGAIESALARVPSLVIADGHHRYSTSLAYRDDMRRRHPDAPPDAAFNYIAAMLVSADDPDLVILPTHREIRHFTARGPAEILDRARQHFEVTPAADLRDCLDRAGADETGQTFGFYGGAGAGFHSLRLRDEEAAISLNDAPYSRAWKRLTVSVLHGILLEKIAGVPYSGIESEQMIRYQRDASEAARDVDAGLANFAFFVKPTAIGDVLATAGRGEIMPQKSTDFYPKAVAGLVMMPVEGAERL